MTPRLMTLVVAPILAAVVLLSSCGSTTAASDVPSLNGSNSGNGATTTTIDPQKAAQEFVTCLRKQGLDVADPKVGADGQIDFRSIFQSANVSRDSDTFRAAQQKCGDKLRNAGFGPSAADQKQRQVAQLAFTACLRKQGLTVGDLPEGRGGFGGNGPGGAIPDGGRPSGSGATTTTVAGGSANGNSSANGSGTPPGGPDGGPPRTDAEREARLAQRLSLDISDPAVSTAFKACSKELAAINSFRGGRGATTTTAG